jgi:hypothetical protein
MALPKQKILQLEEMARVEPAIFGGSRTMVVTRFDLSPKTPWLPLQARVWRPGITWQSVSRLAGAEDRSYQRVPDSVPWCR